MTWQQLQIKATAETTEIISDLLLSLGASAVTLLDANDQPLLEPAPGQTPLWDEAWVSGLFDENTSLHVVLNQLNVLLNVKKLEYRIIPLEDKNWIQEWLIHFRPMRFGKHLWITQEAHRAEITDTNATVVILDPGLAFGTGTHQTTALCLEWLENHVKPGSIVIDYGCGSGILAISALKLGAAKVYAIDNDPQAITATKENAQRNSINDSQLILLYPNEANLEKSDILIANILANPLIELAPTFLQLLKPQGLIALSGILTDQIEKIQKVYSTSFDLDLPEIKDEWALIAGKKKVT